MPLLVIILSCGVKRPDSERHGIYKKYKKSPETEKCISKDRYLTNQLHVFEKGDTLYKLSKIYNVSVDELINANNIEDPRDIKIGKIILIPGVYNANFQWPTIGKISSYYGRRRRNFHTGVDISAKKGTDIKAIADGLVIVSGNSLDGYRHYGRVIVIDHGNGVQSLYAHNDKNYVQEGQCVKKGEVIAEVGSTGNATGNHVHLEIIRNGKTVNPLKYLDKEDGFERP